jgi:predicted metal-dependent peptidase
MWGLPGVLPFPGRARDRKFNILFALDTSGSMSPDDLRLGLTELCHLARADQDITVTVLQCDAAIQKVYEISSPDQVDFEVFAGTPAQGP